MRGIKNHLNIFILKDLKLQNRQKFKNPPKFEKSLKWTIKFQEKRHKNEKLLEITAMIYINNMTWIKNYLNLLILKDP